MAKFRRTLNDKQRQAMIRRKTAMAKALKDARSGPHTVIEHRATGSRSAEKNTVIARTHAKNRRTQRLKLTNGQFNKIRMATERWREKMIDGQPGAVRAYLDAIGHAAVGVLQGKLRRLKIHTGQLISSVTHRVENG